VGLFFYAEPQLLQGLIGLTAVCRQKLQPAIKFGDRGLGLFERYLYILAGRLSSAYFLF